MTEHSLQPGRLQSLRDAGKGVVIHEGLLRETSREGASAQEESISKEELMALKWEEAYKSIEREVMEEHKELWEDECIKAGQDINEDLRAIAEISRDIEKGYRTMDLPHPHIILSRDVSKKYHQLKVFGVDKMLEDGGKKNRRISALGYICTRQT